MYPNTSSGSAKILNNNNKKTLRHDSEQRNVEESYLSVRENEGKVIKMRREKPLQQIQFFNNLNTNGLLWFRHTRQAVSEHSQLHVIYSNWAII